MILSTGSAENGLLVSNGNVGIGTSNPQAKLDVNGKIHATGDICTNQSGGKCLSSAGSASDKYKECYPRCKATNDATFNAGETRVFLWGSGTGCATDEISGWVKDAKGIDYHCYIDMVEQEAYQVNGVFFDEVHCRYLCAALPNAFPSSCAICCK